VRRSNQESALTVRRKPFSGLAQYRMDFDASHNLIVLSLPPEAIRVPSGLTPKSKRGLAAGEVV
jgi:hypothetical protein